MKIEHIGFLVDKPLSMADWWVSNLGFKVLRRDGTDAYGVCFLKDDGDTVLEFGSIPTEQALDFNKLEPLQVHIAIDCSDTESETRRLIANGAVLVGESPLNDFKNERILLRDPFGAVIQLVNRKGKLV